MSSPGHPAPDRSPVVRPLWSLVGPAFGAMVTAGLLTAPIGSLGNAINADLGLSAAAMTVTIVPYAVATAALLAPGYLLGRRWPTATALPALVLLALGCMVIALAPGAGLLMVGMVVAGLGAGTVTGVALALSGQSGRWRSQARLVLGLAFVGALLLGPVASGLVTQTMSWRTVFMFVVPMVAVAGTGTVASGIAMWVARGSGRSVPSVPAATTQFSGPTQIGGPGR